MSLDSSRFFAGELVEVRRRDEILQTLDRDGRHENLPFMPEMLAFCGQRFRVAKRAHKTCDFINHTGGRALPRSVHLEGLRCDGAAHGGCQAACLLFWKDAWLRRPGEPASSPVVTPPVCDEPRLRRAVTESGRPPADPVYCCQATLLPRFTAPLSPWDLRQYLEDFRSGNVTSPGAFVARAAYRIYDNLINAGVGLGRPLRALYNFANRLLGRTTRYPGTTGAIPPGTKTPAQSLALQPGEWVRVRDHAAILATLDAHGRNRGLSFSAEMVPYCGGVYRVLRRVDRIVDEKTGRMLRMKSECIVLESVVCRAQFNRRMIFCPRATYSYWREIWLERVAAAAPLATPASEPVVAAGA